MTVQPPLPNPNTPLVNPDRTPTPLWFRAFTTLWNAVLNGLGPGQVQAWAPTTVPQGWLRTDGSAVSRITYAGLFAAIGTTYGIGDGTTTFNLPNWSVGGVDQIIRV